MSVLRIPVSIVFYFTLFLLVAVNGISQNGTWTWMKGNNAVNLLPNYGIQGVSSPTNDPGSVYEAAEWSNNSDTFWLFSGINSFNSGYSSALWRYVVSTNEWTWMHGPSNLNSIGIYGTQNIPSPLNHPGARSYAAKTWTDHSGNLWLFGGNGIDALGNYSFLNDLWKYNVSTNEWTWMHGPQTVGVPANYGIQGVPSPSNLPDAYQESAATWVDTNGDLWMFGGVDGSMNGNDAMWRFSIATNEWTWMSGQSTGPVAVNYGVLQIPSPSNTPGTRFVYSHWQDAQGNFWLFSGNGLAPDMWMYNPNTLLWTWMAGSNTSLTAPTFTNQCIPGGIPFQSIEDRVCWTDQCGRFWATNSSYSLLWMFDPVSLQFTWVTGGLPNTPPVLGTQTIPSPNNYPPAVSGGNGFVDASGNFWMFGGVDNSVAWSGNCLNLLFRYQPDPNCPGTTPYTQINYLPSNTGCSPFTVQFSSVSNFNLNYTWNFGDTTTLADTSNLVSPIWTFTQPGTYTVTLIASGISSCGVGTDTVSTVITVYPQPQVNLGSDTTICSGPVNLLLDAGNPGSSYVWSTGATSQTLAVNTAGTYAVTVAAGPNGLCSTTDSISISQPAQPNLGGDTILCAGQSLLLDPDVTGTQYNWSTGATTPTITVNAAGLYSVQIINAPCTLSSSMTLGITPLPVVNLGTDTTLCPGDSVLLDAQNPGATYLWSNAATSQTITTAAAGTYAVTVTAQNCSNSDTIAIATTQNLAFNETVSLCGSFGPLVLDAGNSGAAYLWSTGASSQSISIEQPGTYWVTVNAPPCLLTDTVLITGTLGEAAVYIPNSFTPNGDGLNDRFSGYGESFSSFRLLIFNRWGELIFETTDPAGWDGNYNGIKATDDVYVYKLTYTSACTGGKFVDRLGHVTLMR